MRHIVPLSGGKDSRAMAIYLSDRGYWRKRLGKGVIKPGEKPFTLPSFEPIENMEYVFADTHKELPETYSFLDRLEKFLGKPITRLNDHEGFDYWLNKFGGFLPSPRARWCTTQLKIYPFEKYVGQDPVCSYIGLRFDEHREGYKTSDKTNITPVYPFKEDRIIFEDVIKILNDSGVGYPDYYEWRTRSGCFFCFFQRKIEWAGLKERHPDLYEQAKAYEAAKQHDISEQDEHTKTVSRGYTWQHGESLVELERPERLVQIRKKHERKLEIKNERELRIYHRSLQRSLWEILPNELLDLDQDDDETDEPCLACEI